VHHAFVLQQDSSHTLYGIALRVWSRADEKRAETIRELRKKTEPDFYDNPDETYWIPYCLSFLSRYPLYDLLGDYLRGMWIHWNKATNLFHAEEVSRILSFPAPRLNDLVRIDMKDYALCYQFPSSPTGFQNFAMWPLFCCLSIPNIVGVIEAAVSPTRRIIFISHYPAMLTMAAETVRFCVRVYEWSGLYVPVVHARHARDLVQEPGPYILGITAECRSLFTAPPDALVVDLDRNFVLTSNPPNVLTPGQRTKFINRLTQALNGDVTPTGVPQHLRSAYGGGKLIPAGQIIVMKGEVESVQDPPWWNQDAVMSVMDHVCEKLVSFFFLFFFFLSFFSPRSLPTFFCRNANFPTGTQHRCQGALWRLREEAAHDQGLHAAPERDRARTQPVLARCPGGLAGLHQPQGPDGHGAVQGHQAQQLPGRGIGDLEAAGQLPFFCRIYIYTCLELTTDSLQFLKFQTFAEQLTKETSELKVKIENHKRENRRLTALIDQQKDDLARLTLRLSGTEKQRDDALEALVLQQEIAEELERERKRNQKELAALQQANATLTRQRDEAQRIVVHLRSLIDGQAHHMEHLLRSIGSAPDISDYIKQTYENALEDPEEEDSSRNESKRASSSSTASSRSSYYRADSRRRRSGGDGNVSAESLLNIGKQHTRKSRLSMSDVADRYLRDKTDAIADIIRNISEQCAAAVEGLHRAQDAELGDPDDDDDANRHDGGDDGHDDRRSVHEGSELGDGDHSYLNPDNRSSVPPTPDLVHNRSSTSMSMVSSSTIPERASQQYDIPTKIVEDDDEHAHETDGVDDQTETGTVSKQASEDFLRPATRLVA